jgi:3-oxoacyl-[acyl-carrier protein] reductase
VSGTPKRALVTGGSGGIGAAVCRRLARAGHFVYVHAHQGSEAAGQLVGEISAEGGLSQVVTFDVADAAATTAALEAVLAAGAVQIVVNSAGLHDDAAFPAMTAAQWQRVHAVIVDGFFHVTQALLLPMIRTRWGRIINISSVAAQIGNRGQVNYASAKGALISATRALALEVATRGITVNAVAPGIIATRMSAGSFDAALVEKLVPMNRAGEPGEVADLVAFLASDEAAYITGQVVGINGGMST